MEELVHIATSTATESTSIPLYIPRSTPFSLKMLARVGLRSLVCPLSNTTAITSVRRSVVQSAYNFLPKNALAEKPREKGLTEIRGPYYFPVTATYLDELLSDWGSYVDGIKFAGGAFSLMPEERLRLLIDVAHKHGPCECPSPITLRLPFRKTVMFQRAVSSNAFSQALPALLRSSPSI